MAQVSKTRTYNTGDTLTAAYYNADRDEIIAGVNSIDNTQIASDAAIAYSKLNLTGSIVNADISATAAIAYSKLNLAGSIVDADISSSAAISYSKLNLTGNIVNADISDSAAIAYSKLNLTGAIQDSDLAGSISPSKISGTAVTLSGTETLSNKTLSSPVINGSVSGSAIKDEDNMASNSATALATQQSIKAYVDNKVASKKVNRAFTWGIRGTLVTGNAQGMKFIAPQNLTCVKLYARTGSGSCTIRIKEPSETLKNSFSVSSSVSSTTSFDQNDIEAGDLITLDITSVNNAVDLWVTLECEQ